MRTRRKPWPGTRPFRERLRETLDVKPWENRALPPAPSAAGYDSEVMAPEPWILGGARFFLTFELPRGVIKALSHKSACR